MDLSNFLHFQLMKFNPKKKKVYEKRKIKNEKSSNLLLTRFNFLVLEFHKKKKGIATREIIDKT